MAQTRIALAATLTLASLSVTGCYQDRRFLAPAAVFPEHRSARFWEGVQDHEVVADIKKNTLSADVLRNYQQLPDADKVAERNRIITSLMFLIDQNYERFTYQIYSGRAQTSVAMDMTVLGLTGAATVVGGESAKTLLAAIATVVEGSRLSIDKNLFFEQASPVLIATMSALRETHALRIATRMTENDADAYTLTMGLSDVITYYQAGTIPAAIAQLGIDASVRTNKVKIAELINLRNQLYAAGNSASGEAINNLLPEGDRQTYVEYQKALNEADNERRQRLQQDQDDGDTPGPPDAGGQRVPDGIVPGGGR